MAFTKAKKRLTDYGNNIVKMLNGQPLSYYNFFNSDFAKLSWFDSYFVRNWLVHHPSESEKSLYVVRALEGKLVVERADAIRQFLEAQDIDKEMKDLGTDRIIDSFVKKIMDGYYNDQFFEELARVKELKLLREKEKNEARKEASDPVVINQCRQELEIKQSELANLESKKSLVVEKAILRQEIQRCQLKLDIRAWIKTIDNEYEDKILKLKNEKKKLIESALKTYISNYLAWWKQEKKNPTYVCFFWRTKYKPKFICPFTKYYQDIVNPVIKKPRASKNSRTPEVSRISNPSTGGSTPPKTPPSPLTPTTPGAVRVGVKKSSEGKPSSPDFLSPKSKFRDANEARDRKDEPSRTLEKPVSPIVVANVDQNKYPGFFTRLTKNPLRWINAISNFFTEGVATLTSKLIRNCYNCFSRKDNPLISILKGLLLGVGVMLPAGIVCGGAVLTMIVTDGAVNFVSGILSGIRDGIHASATFIAAKSGQLLSHCCNCFSRKDNPLISILKGLTLGPIVMLPCAIVHGVSVIAREATAIDGPTCCNSQNEVEMISPRTRLEVDSSPVSQRRKIPAQAQPQPQSSAPGEVLSIDVPQEGDSPRIPTNPPSSTTPQIARKLSLAPQIGPGNEMPSKRKALPPHRKAAPSMGGGFVNGVWVPNPTLAVKVNAPVDSDPLLPTVRAART